jgi:uncharacterized oligopeptide transporter (OPT) family protein
VAWIFSKARPATDEKYTVPVASGLIAGESLMGVVMKLGIALPQLLEEVKKLLSSELNDGA